MLRTSPGFPQPLHPRQLPRQAYRLQVVVDPHKGTGVLSEAPPRRRVVEQGAHLVCQTLDVEEVHEPPRPAVLDRLANRRRVTRDYRAAYAHRLEEAPTENEGIGQVHVDRRDLKKGHIVVVGYQAQKMHPLPVLLGYLRPHLVQEYLFPRAVSESLPLRQCAVAHTVPRR